MNNNMNVYQKKLKENIHLLIEKNKLDEAKELLEQYENIVSDDIDIHSIKGVIAMMEGDVDGAEKVLKEGLTVDETSFDLLYNLAYLYESSELNQLATEYYKKALFNAEDENDTDSVYEILKGLGVQESKQQIIDNATYHMYYDKASELERVGIKSDAALYCGLAYRNVNDNNIKNKLIGLFSHNQSLRNIFDVASKGKQKKFIILSSCGWGDVYQRMHHIARSLAKFEHEVIYITPNVSINVNNDDVINSELTKQSLKNMKVVDNVKIFMPISAKYNQKQVANNYIHLIQSILDSHTESKNTVIITYMPYQVQVINSLKGSFFHIYECVDDHSDLEYAFWGNKKDVIWEQELMDKADAITTTATSLFLQRRAIEGRENVYLSRNAVNESDFIYNEEEEIPEDLKNIPEPRIVYTGAIYKWFDADLFYEVVKANPDKSFVIIGFGKDDILKEKYPNLYILGPRKHSELKSYLRHMDIGIIPFKSDTDIIINCDPIKHYEYIACGLPVITTLMPEAAIDKINTFLADTKEKFNKAIEKCLNLKINSEAISNFIAENSWNDRAALLCRLADESISKEEQIKSLQNIGRALNYITEEYDSPIFKILEAVYLNIWDSKKFEELAVQVYASGKQRYIEKQYLTALLRNSNMDSYFEVALNSPNINEEVKKELLYCKEKNKADCINVIAHICIGDVKQALNLINGLDENTKLLYETYIRYRLGEEIEHPELSFICKNNQRLPLFIFLKKVSKSKRYSNSTINFNLNKNPFISIIIPTRNSADVLRHALMTCIEQKCDNYEIIVSDNSSPGNEETRQLVGELNCKKIKYFRTPKEYVMKENYEYAYGKSNGDYILLMGSDDGLLLHCIELLSMIIKKLNRPKSITWDPIAYGWPNVSINSIRNGLFIPYPSQKNNIKYSCYGESYLKAVLNFEARYSVLPMFYYNSIVKRDLVEEAKKIAGRIFYASADVSTGLIFAYLQKEYIHINVPMTIGGSSKKSVGLSYINDISKSEYDKFRYEMEQLKKYNNITADCDLFYMPSFATEETAVLISFIISKSLFLKQDKELNINMYNYYKACAKYLFNDNDFEKKKMYLFKSIKEYGNKEIIGWYEENYINNKEFKGHINYQQQPLVASYRTNGGLILDCSRFNVSDVFGAADLYRSIVGY